jgi:hypothetical protein
MLAQLSPTQMLLLHGMEELLRATHVPVAARLHQPLAVTGGYGEPPAQTSEPPNQRLA